MTMYYIRWPNGDHTLASAQTTDGLWRMLDEEGDGYDADVLVAELDGEPFAIDWKMPADDAEDGSPDVKLYEATMELLDKCVAMDAADMVSGTELFAGAFERTYGKP